MYSINVKLIALLSVRNGFVQALKARVTISQLVERFSTEERSQIIWWLSQLEKFDLVESEMAVIRAPTQEQPKGLASRVYWASALCLALDEQLQGFLKTCG